MNIDHNSISKFKELFTSTKNKNYIFNLVYSKLYDLYPKDVLISNDKLYTMHLNSLQSYIFDTFFSRIFNDLQKQDKMSLENLIILLNKITMEQFEHLIHHDMNIKNKNKVDNLKQSNQIYTQLPKEIQMPSQQIQSQQQFQQRIQMPSQQQFKLQKQDKNKEVDEKKQKDEFIKKKEELRKLEIELRKKQEELNIKELELKNKNKLPNDKNIDTKNKLIQTDQQSETNEMLNEIMTSYHLISSDSYFQNGNYNFKVECNNIKSIHLIRFWMECNMYNINEFNNLFYIYENDIKIKINIPIGYYKIKELVNTIEILLNKYSINKLKYVVFHDHLKNKVFFTCTSREDFPINFMLMFENQNKYTPLHKMLGFKLLEYSGNNMYVSENHAKENIFDNIYLRMFLENKEICKYIMSNGSSYFECFNLNYGQYFGKGFDTKNEDIDVFDMFENINCNDISIELIDSEGNLIIKPIEFHIVLGLECLE